MSEEKIPLKEKIGDFKYLIAGLLNYSEKTAWTLIVIFISFNNCFSRCTPM